MLYSKLCSLLSLAVIKVTEAVPSDVEKKTVLSPSAPKARRFSWWLSTHTGTAMRLTYLCGYCSFFVLLYPSTLKNEKESL